MNAYQIASWYMGRYAPSRARIGAYLSKKRIEDIHHVLDSIGYDEDVMLKMWIQTYIQQQIGLQMMRYKLIKKEFEKHRIDTLIQAYVEQIYSWDIYKETIDMRIRHGLHQGKSRRSIQTQLI